MLKLYENDSNIDFLYETDKFSFEKSHGNRNFGLDLLATVRVFKNQNQTEIRFPHIPNSVHTYTLPTHGTTSDGVRVSANMSPMLDNVTAPSTAAITDIGSVNVRVDPPRVGSSEISVNFLQNFSGKITVLFRNNSAENFQKFVV